MPKPPVALQLYTLRQALAEDFPRTLNRIAEMGFTTVETAFLPNHVTFGDAAQALRNAGLRVCGAHCELPLGDQRESVLEIAEQFETDRIIWHGWPRDPDYETHDGVKRLAERYNRANEICAAHSMRFGIHNHWWEFEAVEDRYPYQILIAEMEPTIFFELDAYWAKTAGVDPVVALKELEHRVPLIHIKDGPATQDDCMVAVGQGTMDVPSLIETSNEKVDWYIIELDRCATDMFCAVRESRRYLIELLT